MSKMKKATRRAAARMPNYVRDIAFTKWSRKKQDRYDNRRLGKMGPASEVRIIAVEEERIEC